MYNDDRIDDDKLNIPQPSFPKWEVVHQELLHNWEEGKYNDSYPYSSDIPTSSLPNASNSCHLRDATIREGVEVYSQQNSSW